MSTLNVENIKHPSSSTPAISLDSNGAMTGSFPYPNRNLIYNGAMQVAQRGTTSGVGVSIDGYYTADRWRCTTNSMGLYTQTIENDAPTGSGFRKSFKLLCSTADASPAAGDYTVVEHRLEGQDLQGVAKGTSNAKQLTMSFWVKSNVPGTYTVNLWDLDNARLVAADYAIGLSATWEKKIITFPADTTGEFDNDNGLSLRVYFNLGAGTDFTSGTLATSWETYTAANRMVGQTNLAASVNNYWQITGVQLETGSVATEFEHESYGTTLAKCQRYFYAHAEGNVEVVGTGLSYATNQVYVTVHFPTTMRIWNPTAISANGTNYFRYYVNATTDTFNSLATQTTSANSAVLYQSSGVSTTINHVGWVITYNSDSYIHFDAEL